MTSPCLAMCKSDAKSDERLEASRFVFEMVSKGSKDLFLDWSHILLLVILTLLGLMCVLQRCLSLAFSGRKISMNLRNITNTCLKHMLLRRIFPKTAFLVAGGNWLLWASKRHLSRVDGS